MADVQVAVRLRGKARDDVPAPFIQSHEPFGGERLEKYPMVTRWLLTLPHARFLGGRVVVTSLGYPTMIFQLFTDLPNKYMFSSCKVIH